MNPPWNLYLTKKRGISTLEFLLALVILSLLISIFTSTQKTVTTGFVASSLDGEQLLQMNTAIDCIRQVCYQAYAVKIIPATYRYSKKIVFQVSSKYQSTKVICFYLEPYTGKLYESIQAEDYPGIIQLAIGIKDIDFCLSSNPRGPLLEVYIQGDLLPKRTLHRCYFLSNVREAE